MTGQYGFPPPGGVLAPPHRSRWATVGAPVAVLLLILAVAAALISRLTTTAGPDARPAQRAASAYAKALVEQRFAEATQMFCARDKAAISPASLAEHFFRPQLTEFRVERVAVAHAQGALVGRAAVRFTTATGRYHSTDLPLVEENGTWRPCP